MLTDLVEGASDKSESGLRRILTGQSRLRLLMVTPIAITEAVLYLTSPHGVAGVMVALTAAYLFYIVSVHLLIRYSRRFSARHLLVATAVLDPISLTAALVVIGEYGSLITGFYLFTILGFGFRTGRPLMYLCQLTAVACFVLVLLSEPYWQKHPLVWAALMLPLVAVPLYAGRLMGTLRAARELAERESQAKSELLAKVSHELRTPLTGIISATELLVLEAGYLPPVARRAETIQTLSNELLSEINELLDEAKFGARALEPSPTAIDLHSQAALLQEALASTAAKKGIEFRIDLDPAILDRVMVDSRLLARVLLNLASNAVKFTDDGSVNVRIDLQHCEPRQYWLRFDVSDTGIGIPESFHDRIFEPFAQVDQGAARRYGGTGLGLTIAHKIVKLLGGDLNFQSQPGHGSRFWFELALSRVAREVTTTSERPAAEAAPPVSPKRILVAEDNETNLLLLQELLSVDHHVVTACTGGLEAIQALAEQDFDLLLLDYNLGDMDGLRVLQTYRFGRRNPAPALFLTADSTQLTAARLRDSACAGILYKPITLSKLRRAMRDIEFSSEPADSLPRVFADAQQASKPSRPQLTAVSSSPLDREIIDELKSVSLRPEFFPALISEAENDIRRNCQQILDAIARRNPASIRDSAHALKGVSANVGAVRLLALATNLMNASREELDENRERWATDLAEALKSTVAALRQELQGYPGIGSGRDPSSLHLG